MMHRLAREIRFSINPFLYEVDEGCNSYASRPCGEGLCLYFSLWVELEGRVDPETGFIINVVEIDQAVRDYVVPIFSDTIRMRYGKAEYILFPELAELLSISWMVLSQHLEGSKIVSLALKTNPYRTLKVLSENNEMILFAEKFEFAAMHTLWNNKFSEEDNYRTFGKCANPTGHGHNYILEVTIQMPQDDYKWSIAEYQRIVEDNFIEIVDHKNLNEDVEFFADEIPTVENLASFAWHQLNGKFTAGKLKNVTVWETDKTFCTYSE